jgi:hypothetical protein
MSAVERLVTLVDLDGTDARSVSMSASQEAVLADGRRLRLVDGRGWTSWRNRIPVEDGSDIWTLTTVEQIVATARTVVGPDEPFAGRSQEEMEADHWAFLRDVLGKQGVVVDAAELKRLPHDVVLSEQLLARVGREGRAGAT